MPEANIVPVAALFGYFGSQLLFKRMLGKVKKTSSGFKKVLRTPKTTATITADKIESAITPGVR